MTDQPVGGRSRLLVCESVAAEYNVSISSLAEGQRYSEEKLTELKEAVAVEFGNGLTGVDLVVCGSFGRRELSRHSDCDFLVMLSGDAQLSTALKLKTFVHNFVSESELEAPGASGLFGDIAITAELALKIGLESDSNSNLTRRMLLITESASVLGDTLRKSALEMIFSRYVANERELAQQRYRAGGIPQFLVNDLLRYWRTVTVDYAAKRWQDPSEAKGALRRAKLLTTRKVMFAGTLASILEIDFARPVSIIDWLIERSNESPIERLMRLSSIVDDSTRDSMGALLDAYCKSLEALSSREVRSKLKMSEQPDEYIALIASTFNPLALKIQSSLAAIFVSDPNLQSLTAHYGLF